MKKIAVSLLILFLSPVLVFSQGKVNIEISTPYKVIDAKEKNYLRIGNTILTVKIAGKNIHMQKLDAASLQFIKVNTFKDMPDGFVIEELTIFNRRIYLFYSLWDRANQTEQLFVREIDIETASFKGEGKLLFSEMGKISGAFTSSGFYNFSVTDKFDFFTSNDSSKMIIQYRMRPEEKRDAINHDLIGMRVYGRNMEVVWGDIIQMPYTEKEMENLDYSVDSDGNAYVLSTVYEDTDIKRRKEEGANYRVELLRIKAFTKNIDKTVVRLDNKFINTIWLYEGPNNIMYCAGFYNNGRNLNNANGIFMFKVGQQGGIYDIKEFEIPVDVLNQYVSARTQKRNDKKDEKDKAEFENLELKEFIIEADGSILLIGEQHYITQHTTYTSNGSRTTYVYHFNDILVTKIDPSGRLAWMKKLPKRQSASSSAYMPRYKGGMSYTLVRGIDGYNILFLDNIKNLDLGINEVPAGHTNNMGGYLISYNINKASGQMIKVPVFDLRNVQEIALYQFSVDRILPLGPDQFVVEAYKKAKQDILIKVKLSK
jgi:hypothetical protein